MSDPFIGQIYLVGYNFAQRGFALCEGQTLPIAQNTALFSLLGTTYGGNATTTFNLPDLRGRTPIGQGQGPGLSARPIGQVGGSETTTLTEQNIPAHSHTAQLMAEDGPAGLSEPSGNLLAQSSIYLGAGRATDVAMNPNAIRVSPTGGGVPVNNMPPFVVMNYEIALQGIFPSRS